MKQNFVIAAIALILTIPAGAADAPAPLVFPAQITGVYRVLLDRDALLLESILDVIKKNGVQDGEVLVTAGSVSECTYHYVSTTDLKSKNVFKTVKGPFEILNAGGIIANGEPHIHITLSSNEKGAFGGHLENGCRVLYLAEVTILKYSGQPLTRAPNQNGISMLKPK